MATGTEPPALRALPRRLRDGLSALEETTAPVVVVRVGPVPGPTAVPEINRLVESAFVGFLTGVTFVAGHRSSPPSVAVARRDCSFAAAVPERFSSRGVRSMTSPDASRLTKYTSVSVS